MTPSETILKFLSEQPDTIRELLYSGIGLDFLPDEEIEPGLDYKAVVIKGLTGGTDRRNFRQAIWACAILDYSFSRPRPSESGRVQEEIADKTGSETLKRLALQQPLKDKHFDNADEAWRALRQSSLSPEALFRHETSLMAAFARSIPGR